VQPWCQAVADAGRDALARAGIGQHTEEVLESIGVTRGQIDQLRRDGAIR